jgi:hypothetical protein
MTYSSGFESIASALPRKPFIASYDLGYEYSQQHYIELQCMIEDADEEATYAHLPSVGEEVAA